MFQQINARVKEASSATTLSTDTEDLDVYVSDEKDEKLKRSDIEKMKIEYTDSQTQKTKKVKLSKIADFSMADTPSSINRINQTRYMTVSLTLGDDYNVGLVSNDVHAVLDKYEMPSGYELEFTGEDENINESIKQVALMFIVGVIFMYLIMVAQFQSLLSPFIILFTIPLAFTGGSGAGTASPPPGTARPGRTGGPPPPAPPAEGSAPSPRGLGGHRPAGPRGRWGPG